MNRRWKDLIENEESSPALDAPGPADPLAFWRGAMVGCALGAGMWFGLYRLWIWLF